MSALEYHQYPYLSDNYGVLIHDPKTGDTAAIDCGDASALLTELDSKGWKLTELWITHHHWDHTDGLLEAKKQTGCKVRGPIGGKSTDIEGLDETYWDGDSFTFGGVHVDVISTPGHTTDMINFHLASEGVVFTGDTLFTLGCGRIFEGDPHMMWASMEKLLKLPKETVVYSSHEYTASNAKFALSVDPDNAVLKARADEVAQLCAEGKPTVPSVMSIELQTNPFLRPSDPAIRKHLGMETESDGDVFAEIRKRKDNF